jgi:hypothetical protein
MATQERVEYHPNGYPNLGLTPRTLKLRYRDGADLHALRRKIERWERQQGNASFEARHIEKLPPQLAYELANVYVAMRERFPDVKPDYIEFAGKESRKVLAWATNYGDSIPFVRDLVAAYDDLDPTDSELLVEIAREEYNDARVIRALKAESYWVEVDAIRNPAATGSIEFGDIFRKKRSYQQLLDFWITRNQRAALRGLPPRTLGNAVSAASFTLIHEFGHLVEAELLELGYRPVEKVYRSLSEIVFGVKNPSDNQWRYHLVNYPTYSYTQQKGPREGGPTRRRETKRVLHLAIRQQFGAYATTCRDELFAEAFAFTFGGTWRMREDMKPFLRALKQESLMVERLPRRI